MKFLSWNIWSSGSKLQEKHWLKAAQEIQQWQPDIIGLQEIDNGWSERSDFADVSSEMADVLGYQRFYAPSIENSEGGQYGNAILSRIPFKNCGMFHLSPEVVWEKNNHTTEPRTAAWVEIAREQSKNLIFITTHLSNAVHIQSTEISKKQTETLLKFIEQIDIYKEIVLVGDFNLQANSQEVQDISSRLLLCDNQAPTWTVHPFEYKGWKENPPSKFIIDHVFSNLQLKVSVQDSLVSDHLPLLAEEVD